MTIDALTRREKAPLLKTKILLVVDHQKPIPDLADKASHRVYTIDGLGSGDVNGFVHDVKEGIQKWAIDHKIALTDEARAALLIAVNA